MRQPPFVRPVDPSLDGYLRFLRQQVADQEGVRQEFVQVRYGGQGIVATVAKCDPEATITVTWSSK